MKRPKVVLQVNASLDGRIAFTPHSTMFTPVHASLQPYQTNFNDWTSFNSQVKSLHEADFIMEGCNMLVSEIDELLPLPEYSGDTELLYRDYLPEHIVNRQGRKTWTSVVDGRGRFRAAYKAYTDNPESYMIHLTSFGAPPEYLAFLQREEIPYLLAGAEKVDLAEIFAMLHSHLNVKCILTSSGGKLAGALIRANLLDEVNILFNPTIYGGETTSTLFCSPDINPPLVLPSGLKYLESKVFDSGAVWVRYEVIKK